MARVRSNEDVREENGGGFLDELRPKKRKGRRAPRVINQGEEIDLLEMAGVTSSIIPCSFAQYWEVRGFSLSTVDTLTGVDYQVFVQDMNELRRSPGKNLPHNEALQAVLDDPVVQEAFRDAGTTSQSYFDFCGIQLDEYKFTPTHMMKMYSGIMKTQGIMVSADPDGNFVLIDGDEVSDFDPEHVIEVFRENLPKLAKKKYRNVDIEDIMLNAGYYEVLGTLTSKGFVTVIKKSGMMRLEAVSNRMLRLYRTRQEYDTPKAAEHKLFEEIKELEEEPYPEFPMILEKGADVSNIKQTGELMVGKISTNMIPVSMVNASIQMFPLVPNDLVSRKDVKRAVAIHCGDKISFVTTDNLEQEGMIDDEEDEDEDKECEDQQHFDRTLHCLPLEAVGRMRPHVLLDATDWREKSTKKGKSSKSRLCTRLVDFVESLLNPASVSVLVDMSKMANCGGYGVPVRSIFSVYVPRSLFIVEIDLDRYDERERHGLFSVTLYKALMSKVATSVAARIEIVNELAMGNVRNQFKNLKIGRHWRNFYVPLPCFQVNLDQPCEDEMDYINELLAWNRSSSESEDESDFSGEESTDSTQSSSSEDDEDSI